MDAEQLREFDRIALDGDPVRVVLSLPPDTWVRLRLESMLHDKPIRDVVDGLLRDGDVCDGRTHTSNRWRDPALWLLTLTLMLLGVVAGLGMASWWM